MRVFKLVDGLEPKHQSLDRCLLQVVSRGNVALS